MASVMTPNGFPLDDSGKRVVVDLGAVASVDVTAQCSIDPCGLRGLRRGALRGGGFSSLLPEAALLRGCFGTLAGGLFRGGHWYGPDSHGFPPVRGIGLWLRRGFLCCGATEGSCLFGCCKRFRAFRWVASGHVAARAALGRSCCCISWT